MDHSSQEARFLGQGFPFPLRAEEGGLCLCSGAEKIRASLYTILMTRQGERPLRPDFGSRIWDYVFDLPDSSAEHLICAEAEQAILRWEHRISDLDIRLDVSGLADGKLVFSLSYRILSINRPDNLVFPFYLSESR